MKGQRGLAWRGAEPEGLRTHTVHTHSSFTHACAHTQEVKLSAAVRSAAAGGVRGKSVGASASPQHQAPPPAAVPQEPAGSLHECLERVGQLELQLHRAQRSLVAPAGSPSMQDGVERQLLTCQAMFLEIEQKVAGLSAVDRQQDGLGAEGSREEAAERLSSKLEVLKADLVQFQLLLQGRQGEAGAAAAQEQRLTPAAQRPLVSTLKRSSSVQEIFSSPRNRLLRQSSLQQQKEFEQELSEQRGLTQAIARHGSRARLHSQEAEDHSQLSPCGPPAVDQDQDPAQRTWGGLLARLLGLQEVWLLPRCEATDSAGRRRGPAGRGSRTLTELQTLVRQLRELGHAAEEESLHQTGAAEGLFDVLHGAALSLSCMDELLPAGALQEEDAQPRLLQSLSAELDTLSSQLASQGSKVSRVLDSEAAQQCVDGLCRVLPVVQAALSCREKQLRILQEDEDEQQAVVRVQASLQQQVEQVSSLPASLLQRTPQLQEEPDELQQQYERLVLSLEELLARGSERLSLQPEAELHHRAHLLQRLGAQQRFFQFLGDHSRILQYLTYRVPESALQRWEGVVRGLQEEAARLQRRGLERGARMERTLQMWSQWEGDAAWSDSLLTGLETSLPTMHQGGEDEQQLSVYQELRGVLDGSEARFSRTLEAGLWLQEAGCRGVGGASRELDARRRALQRRAEQEPAVAERKRRLRSRFLRDSVVLTDWMGGARDMIDGWLSETDAGHSGGNFLRSVALSKDLEAKWDLKVSVVSSGAQLLRLREADCDSPEDPGLRQMELDWWALQAAAPAAQRALHERWVKTLTQQGALRELQAWLDAAESRLEEHLSGTSRTSDLSPLLQHCKECRTEMSAHQATLDHVNQLCSAEEDQRGRCERNRFAEEQGGVNRRWLRLQETLNTQIQEAEQELRSRAEQEVRLQQTSSWITERSLWMDSARTPASRAALRRSVHACQDLEETARRRSAALQDKRDVGADLTTQKSIDSCTALTRRSEALKDTLVQTQQLWDGVDERLNLMAFKAVKRSQTLELHSRPQICLQAHRDVLQQLQLLLEDTAASEADWDELSRSVWSLRDRISPAAAGLLTEQLDRARDGWTAASTALDQQLQRSGGLLQVWEVYAGLAASASQRLQTLQRDVEAAPSETATDDSGVEEVAAKIQEVQGLLQRTHTLQSDLQGVLEAHGDLVGHLGPSAAGLVQSECRLLSRGVQQLSQALAGRRSLLQEELGRLQEFEEAVACLEGKVELWEERLQAQTGDQSDLLALAALSADLDVLNERSCALTLGDAAARRLRRLNRRWSAAAARAEETCSELQAEALRRQNFQQKCESWTSFLQRMEDGLAVDVAGSYSGLRKQLCTHKRFQTELSIGHQILHAVISESLHLLQRGEVDDRSDFILKLAQLREHWQGAVQRADQRRSLVDGLVKHWHLYSRSLRKLQRFLADTQTLLPPAGPARCSLQQLRRLLQDLQHTELLFQRHQCSFIHTLDVGRQLFSMGDQETQTQLQAELGTLQEEWDGLHGLLGRRMELTEAIVKKWERCEAGLTDRAVQLKDVKTRLNQSLPESDDELQDAGGLNKENEDSLEDWAESLTELSAMKTDLSQYIIADDVLLLQEQAEHLHCQWEELCLKVSLRKQEIGDRLNAWIIFKEKNKELCEWLAQMENKVAHNSDLNIEEMVEKLKKDCMEEINLFSENKTHLKQLGEQLITASNKTKETEINDKLTDVGARWQHLFDHIEARVRKLKETLVTVQQLDKNMSNLRTWLSRIEAELARPVVYSVCHSEEIQRKLTEQQDLQRDIEQHAAGVASVLTLCDVLLHDADACSSDAENDSIQQTTRSLDRRWRNICAMSMERRMRIEETWRLWSKFLEDYSRFEDWLKTSELAAANPDSANVLYTSAKEELKKFEAFQRQVHERLTQLELVNKQYRRLARENRTDAASRLKVTVHEGNRRWDGLQRRVAAVLRRLKHFTSQREDFEGTREGILVWLTEMDLQLTNVEHFSESDIEDKMRQLNGFQQEITLNTNKIDALIVFGENLIQKSAPLDAVLIEDELEELHSYCQEVFGRVARFHQRLVTRRPVLEEERELSDLDESSELSGGAPWREARKKKEAEVSAGRQAVCHLLAPPLERSGRETPVSVDSIPLEWDHTVDVGGSSSHEDDEDATFFSALSVKSVTDPPSWHQPGSPQRKRVPREILRGLSASPTHAASTPGYVKLMTECSGSIDSVKRVKLILNDEEEEPEDPGLTSSTADKQTSTGVIERWELLQAHKFSHSAAADVQQDLQQWQKLNSDLCDVTSWLGRVLPELERLQRIAPSTSVRDFEVNIRKLKEMQKSFNSFKCLMISVNLSSRHFLPGDSGELRELQEALGSANHSWTQACGGLESWERRLHAALMQCQEFHETLHSLLLWLAQAESRLRSVDVGDPATPRAVLTEHRGALTTLQEELRGRQRQVSSLQDISSQLLLEAAGDDSVEAKEKVHVICNKLRLLLRQTAADLQALPGREETSSTGSEEETLDASPLQLEEATRQQAATAGRPATRRDERRDSAARRPLFHRVLRAAFPLHLVFLVLLVLACLVPLSEQDYSCTLSNNFARSFYPMLRYTNGPPPT